MKQLSEIEFLGFVIKTDRKGECDLWGDIETIGDVWKSDLGHFSSVRLAKKAAVFCFMIQNPKIFHAVIGR